MDNQSAHSLADKLAKRLESLRNRARWRGINITLTKNGILIFQDKTQDIIHKQPITDFFTST